MDALTYALEGLREFWPHVAGGILLVMTLGVSAHAILYKRESRASVSWIALVLLVPLLGTVLYLLFGINRIQRRASALRLGERMVPIGSHREGETELATQLGPSAAHLVHLSRLVGEVTKYSLLPGNRAEPLFNGDQAFPAMLESIARARRSVSLLSYIFDADRAGRAFVDALGEARRRGVEVRVLVDDAGSRYSRPNILRLLSERGVPASAFLPTSRAILRLAVNLRNHRKIMVVDGETAFTGGMNLREGNLLAENPRVPVQDLHFRVCGPVVSQIQEIFAEDWRFATGEPLEGEAWFPNLATAGPASARGIPDGPDEDFQTLPWVILGAVASARESVRIVTPYFLPEADLISALNVAALRGVRVDILLPSRSNLRYMDWAMMGDIWQVLGRGCRVALSPPPFDHSKLMLVDGTWVLFGSTNLDPRSLRLNFEFNLEVYDADLGARLAAWFDGRMARARRLEMWDLTGRSLPVRLRDGVARLFKPYI